MKKWLFSLLIIVILALISVYIFIPYQIKISSNSSTACDIKNITFFLHDQQKWSLWWPGSFNENSADSSVRYNGYSYRLTKALSNGAEMSLTEKQNKLAMSVFLFPLSRDSTAIVGETVFAISNNPFKRVAQYFEAVQIKKNMDTIVGSLGRFVNQTKNVYGINVIKEKVKIDFLVSTKKTFLHYPSTLEVYEMIDALKNYISKHGAKEIDYPMLHVTAADSNNYFVQTAIPVDIKLPETNNFSFKWMPKGGNMLTSEIKGGEKTVEWTMKQFSQYVSDRQLTVMAIPFESLITDRRKETDTSKWVTKLYYPVM